MLWNITPKKQKNVQEKTKTFSGPYQNITEN